MLQTKARDLTKLAQETRKNQNIIKCEKWVEHITDTSIRRKAEKGQSETEIKVPRKFAYTFVCDSFIKLGYTVETVQKPYITIRW